MVLKASKAEGVTRTVPALSDAAVLRDMDESAFLQELCKSRQEVEIARKQFDIVTDPMLIDHIVFRLGAAEKHLNYLFQLARRMNFAVDGIRWEWFQD